MSDLSTLLAIMSRLRDPKNGCEWDLAQTYATICPHTIEEAYEVADAIQRQDFEGLKEELGDLLFQIVFYSQLGYEENKFEFSDIVNAICEKMIARHPKIFVEESQDRLLSEDYSELSWEEIKTFERQKKAENIHPSQPAPVNSVLDGIAWALPALAIATKLQERASMVGFDWPEVGLVADKICEELEELQNELDRESNETKIEEEFGDLLFACTNLGRHLGINPEEALRKANRKFERRFRRVEVLTGQGAPLPANEDKLGVMQRYWEQVKLEE